MFVQVLFGVIFAAAGIYGLRSGRGLRKNGIRTTGSVVDMQRDYTGGNQASYFPVVQFRDSSGELIEARTSEGGSPPPARVGDQVPVRYNPANPSTCEIDTFMGRGTFLPAGAAVIGLALIVFAFVKVPHL